MRRASVASNKGEEKEEEEDREEEKKEKEEEEVDEEGKRKRKRRIKQQKKKKKKKTLNLEVRSGVIRREERGRVPCLKRLNWQNIDVSLPTHQCLP